MLKPLESKARLLAGAGPENKLPRTQRESHGQREGQPGRATTYTGHWRRGGWKSFRGVIVPEFQ